MTTTIHPASVEPMVAGLMSGIDVADGPGDEQLAVFRRVRDEIRDRIAAALTNGEDSVTRPGGADIVWQCRRHLCH